MGANMVLEQDYPLVLLIFWQLKYISIFSSKNMHSASASPLPHSNDAHNIVHDVKRDEL